MLFPLNRLTFTSPFINPTILEYLCDYIVMNLFKSKFQGEEVSASVGGVGMPNSTRGEGERD